MTKVSITISNLEFKDSAKSSLDCSPNDIVVFVGANNCGKTTCLREVINFTSKEKGSFNPKFFEKIEFLKPNSSEEFKSFIRVHARKSLNAADQYNLNNHNFGLDHFASLWSQNTLNYQIGAIFIHNLKTEERLLLTTKSSEKLDYELEPASSPLQKIDDDGDLADSVSEIFSKLFFKDLVVDPSSGGKVVLRVGIKPDHTKENDRRSKIYRDKVRQLPRLEEQGDGVRSAAGIILELWTSSFRTILVLDEPEAFLHPPQAKELGKIIANERPSGQQLFIATHSSDFIKGLMESNSSDVHIIRLDRNKNDDSTTITILKNEDLKNLLKDSWLKYSNAIDSVFYQETILCEADADSRFYNAVLDSCAWDGSKPEAFFLPCGGKGKFQKAANHLIKLGVKPKIIADIDIIVGDDTKILYKELGGNYSEIQNQHKALRDFISTNSNGANKVSESEIYKKIKKNGKSEFGKFQSQFEFLVNKCSEVGLFILPVGELESWYKEITAQKSDEWLSKLFDQVQNFATEQKLDEARNFILSVFDQSKTAADVHEVKQDSNIS